MKVNISEMKKRLVMAEPVTLPAETARAIIEALEKAEIALNNLLGFAEEGCRFDHNGNCQNHGSFGGDNGCDVANAFETFKEIRSKIDFGND